MSQINVTQTLAADTDALWGVVRAFGEVGWIPGGESAEIQGEGPGMVRIFQGPKGAVHEKLESVDEAKRAVVYTIPQGIPFPVTGYRATMEVSDDGGKGRLSWTCEFEPDGVSAEEAGKTIETMYGVMMGWIDDLIAKG
jgi:hypothetical protein